MTLSRLYEGTDNLEAMEAAVNYNGFLDEVINKYAPAKGTFLDFGAGTSGAPMSTHVHLYFFTQ